MKDKEAFKSAFQQSRRNIPFFVVMAYGVSFLPGFLGVVGAIIAAASAILYVVFLGQALLSTALSLFSLITWPFRPKSGRGLMQPGWVALACLLTAVDVTAYALCIYFVGKAAGWWGLF